MTNDARAARYYWALCGVIGCAMLAGGIVGWALRGFQP